MACKVGNGVGGLEEVTFLYKLTLGACPKSYGVNVARLAGKFLYSYFFLVVYILWFYDGINKPNTRLTVGSGLPDDVLQKAATKSEEFEMMYGKNKKHSKTTNLTWDDEMVVILQNIRNCLVDTPCSSSANSIFKLQNRAKMLLDQK